MMSTKDETGQGGADGGVPGYLAYVPPAWLAVIMLLSLQGGLAAWPALSDYRLPDSAVNLLYAAMIADLATILWGLYVLGLAYNRSRRFPSHFIAWQAAIIVWLVAREIYVLVAPDFMFSPVSLAWTAGEIAVGLFCIYLVRRNHDAASFYSNPESENPPLLVSAIAAVLGVILGAVLGFGGGLLGGAAIAEWTDMSCFEGACGYFAFFLGLFGLLAGAVVGGVVAVWRTNRRRKPAA